MDHRPPSYLDRLALTLAVLDVSALAFLMLDGVGAAIKAELDWAIGLALPLYLLPIYLILTTLAAPLIALTPFRPGGTTDSRRSGGEHRAALFLATAGFLAHERLVHWASVTFKNHELAALLVSLSTLTGVVLLLSAFRTLANHWNGYRQGLVGGRILDTALALFCFGALGWLTWNNRDGFEQLDPWTLGIPLAAGLIFGLASWRRNLLNRFARRWVWVHLIALVAGVFLFAIFENAWPRVGKTLSQHGPWASYWAAGIQKMTDFDGDGHASWMGGGDCMPWNDQVYPGQAEIPGDGIDNNCVGGDAIPFDALPSAAFTPLPATVPADLNLVLVTIDAVRPDHTSLMGYERPTTPTLDSLAEESTLFNRFYATSSFTRLSIASLMSGRAPSEVTWLKQKKKKYPQVARSNPWFPEALRKSKIKTSAILVNFQAFTTKDNLQFQRGFDRYDTTTAIQYTGGTMKGFPGEKQVDKAIRWIDQNRSRRFMLWIHLVEPHYKYERHKDAPDFGQKPQDLYDSEIWAADHQLGRLVEHLKERELWPKTALFVTGDHGEEFGEHGKRFHGSSVYEEQVRTIGLLRVPGLKAARIDTPVSFVDVPPTLLNVLGLKDQMKPFKGRSLLTGLLGEPVEKRPVVVETWKVRTLANYRAGLIDWPYKIVTDGSDARLYDLVEDPKEKNELNTSHPRYLELVHKMDQYQDQVQRVYQDAPKKKKKKKKKKLEPRRSLDKAKRSLHHAVDLATPPTSPARFVGPQNPEIKEKIRHKVEKDLRVTSPFQGHREHGTQRAKTKKKPGSK